MINLHLQNAAYFINKLRRKQALIMVKKEIERAIEERDQDCTEMEKQIKEAMDIMNEGGEEDELI